MVRGELMDDSSVRCCGVGPGPFRAVALSLLVYYGGDRVQMNRVHTVAALARPMIEFKSGLMATHQKPPRDAVRIPLSDVRSFGYESPIAVVVGSPRP